MGHSCEKKRGLVQGVWMTVKENNEGGAGPKGYGTEG